MTPQTPPYGRRAARGQQLWAEGNGHNGSRPSLAPYRGQNYYQRSAIKKAHYRWLISSYLFTGGIAGFAQILAIAADLFNRDENRGVVRAGRYVSLGAVLLSPIFLIMDLHTPRRFYNMLRIFRWTSPMSIGSWALSGLGLFAGLAALGQVLEDVGRPVLGPLTAFGKGLGRASSLPGMLFGAVVSMYTGSLLSATSIPLYASVYKLLPPLFGSSAASTGTAATSLGMELLGPKNEEAHHRLEQVAFVSSATELALTVAVELKWKQDHVDTPMHRLYLKLPYRVGVLGMGILLPLAVHALYLATGRRSKKLSIAADLGALLGGYVQRSVITFAGSVSAEEPKDYFTFTQPSVTMGGNGSSEAALFARAGGARS